MNTDNSLGALKRLGILQAGRAPEELIGEFPDYHHMFEKLLGCDAFDYHHWAVLDGDFPADANAADAWLITGSRHGAYDPLEWIPPLEALIRDIHRIGLPMVGICFGHQIIAQALGGKVEKFDQGWSVGRVNYQLDQTVFDFSSDTLSTPLLAFHQDQVIQPPAQAMTVGSSDFCRHAALVYDSSILTLQPHPEFSNDYLERLLDVRGEILPNSVQVRARGSLAEPVQAESIASTLRLFLNRPHG
jgi:GMP synthase (glutamine-hydrolysing)